MRPKSLILPLMIIAFCLVHFELEASDLTSAGKCLPTSATELDENPEKIKSLKGLRNGFTRGTRKWQTYASAAIGDHGIGEIYGKGEMYALHFGYGYFLRDYMSINIDVLGAYIHSGIDDNGGAAGGDLIFRWHFLRINDDLWSVYLDLGGGFQLQSVKFSGNRYYNFRVMGGCGGTLRVANHVRIMGGIRLLHTSGANIKGGGGGFNGLMFYTGAMFPF